MPATRLWDAQQPVWNASALVHIAGLGLIPTVLAFLLYTRGLTYIESSKASILATIEPLVATFLSLFLLGEPLTIWQMAGIFFILAAVVIVQGRQTGVGVDRLHMTI